MDTGGPRALHNRVQERTTRRGMVVRSRILRLRLYTMPYRPVLDRSGMLDRVERFGSMLDNLPNRQGFTSNQSRVSQRPAQGAHRLARHSDMASASGIANALNQAFCRMRVPDVLRRPAIVQHHRVVSEPERRSASPPTFPSRFNLNRSRARSRLGIPPFFQSRCPSPSPVNMHSIKGIQCSATAPTHPVITQRRRNLVINKAISVISPCLSLRGTSGNHTS